jgi:hypothetical protein
VVKLIGVVIMLGEWYYCQKCGIKHDDNTTEVHPNQKQCKESDPVYTAAMFPERYQEYVKEVFLDHHDCMGMDAEEAQDLFNESSFNRVEKWLTKIGYDLKTDFSFEVKCR